MAKITEPAIITQLRADNEKLRKANEQMALHVQHVQSDREAIMTELNRLQSDNAELLAERNAALRAEHEARAAARVLRSLVWHAMTRTIHPQDEE